MCYNYRGQTRGQTANTLKQAERKREREQRTLQLSRGRQVDLTQTDGEREREIPERTDYLRKQAASEEVGRPATLTGDSYTDLRRDGGKMSNNKKMAYIQKMMQS